MLYPLPILKLNDPIPLSFFVLAKLCWTALASKSKDYEYSDVLEFALSVLLNAWETDIFIIPAWKKANFSYGIKKELT